MNSQSSTTNIMCALYFEMKKEYMSYMVATIGTRVIKHNITIIIEVFSPKSQLKRRNQLALVRAVLPPYHNIVFVFFLHGIQDIPWTFNIINFILIKS